MGARSQITFAVFCVLFALACKDKSSSPSQKGSRPEGTGTGLHVALVLMLEGPSSVAPAEGEPFTAAPGQGLLVSDQLRTEPGAFLVLQLQSDYLVRIDENLSLQVNDIALLKAPPTKTDHREQLRQLLSESEHKSAESKGVYMRIAGWHMEREGAETAAAAVESVTAGDVRLEKGKVDPSAATGDGTVGQAATPPTEGKSTTPGSTGSTAGAGTARTTGTAAVAATAGPDESPEREPPTARRPPPPEKFTGLKRRDEGELRELRGKGAQPASPSREPAGPEPLDKDELERCVIGYLKALPIEVAEVQVRLQVVDGVVRRVSLSRALPVPTCARDIAAGKATPEAPEKGYVRLTVRAP